ncbi:MAG: hypothetical protein IPL73_13525 [Candidatus Obscuribacter sp.]|nr:hypothetical protein [Candidatus Obscuribacter sp.]
MNKPKLSLALSLLAVAGQAGLLPVVAAPQGDFEPNQLIAQAAARSERLCDLATDTASS